MKRLMGVITTAIVMGLGLITIWGLLPGSPVAGITAGLTQMVVIIGAFAVLIGVLNLLWVHLRRVLKGDTGWPYSIALFFSALTVLILVLLERLGIFGDDSAFAVFLFDAVQVSVESALASLIVFFLVFAAFRLLRHRVTWVSLLFIVTLLVILVGWLQIPALEGFNGISEWLRTVPAAAGARGLLIGVAIGATTVGVRVLLGQDPSYRE